MIFPPEKLTALKTITKLLFTSEYLNKRWHFCMREALLVIGNCDLFSPLNYRVFVRFSFFTGQLPKARFGRCYLLMLCSPTSPSAEVLKHLNFPDSHYSELELTCLGTWVNASLCADLYTSLVPALLGSRALLLSAPLALRTLNPPTPDPERGLQIPPSKQFWRDEAQ